jgi:hypothetical protein
MITYAIGIFGLAGWIFGIRCYVETRSWARQCNGARIAIAYKRKVKLEAPLTEFILWCRQLDKDKRSTGRTIYTMGSTTVAIIKRPDPPRVIRDRIKNLTRKPAALTSGKWTSKDQTPESNKAITEKVAT